MGSRHELPDSAVGTPLLSPLVKALREVFGRASYRKAAAPAARPAAPARPMRFEALEPRVLLSGDVNPAQTVSGQIDVPGEVDQYGFTLPQNARIVFDSLSNTSNVNWSLSGPNGEVVTNRAFNSSDNTSANPLLDLAAGEYTVTVDATGDATPTYTFRLIDLFRAQDVNPDTLVTGSLDPPNDTAVYRFSATAGARFYFDSISASHTLNYRLYDPFGRAMPQPMGTEQAASWDGSYTLVVEGPINGSGIATYSFNVQRIVDDVKVLVPGETQLAPPYWTDGRIGGGLYLDGHMYL